MNDSRTLPAAGTPPSVDSGPRQAWAIMDPVRRRIDAAMAIAAVGVLLGMAALAALALVVGALQREPARLPVAELLAAALCTVGAYGLRLLAFNRSHYAAFRLETLLRTRLAEHVARLSLGEVQRLGAGALAKVVQDDVKALHVFVADSTPLYARAYVAPVATLLVLLVLDWRLALAASAVLAFGVAVMSLAMRGRGEMSRRYHAAREQVSAAIVEFVQAMPVVRSFDTGRATFGRYERALAAYLEMLVLWYRAAGFTARFSMAVLGPLPTLLVLFALGLWLTPHASLAFDRWLAVLLLGTGMAEALMPLMSLMHMVDKAKLSAARIQEVLALAPLPLPAPEQAPNDAGVVFDAVSFAYDPGSAAALEGVSFRVEPGTVTALVGPSGAGKTTVARLIPRFWDVQRGAVRVGGVDVRRMTPQTLMSQVAFVFQDAFLFADTIAANIRLGRPEATPEQVQAAARAAQAHDFIVALPQRYDTPVGERGVFLSGGQRQRLTIARAILQDRPILVLDEATAFADPENEAAIVRALSALMRGRTVIMVAHRLATIRDADQILVFDRGRLVEAGRHDDLLPRAGLYARLWRHHEDAQHWALRSNGAQAPAAGEGA